MGRQRVAKAASLPLLAVKLTPPTASGPQVARGTLVDRLKRAIEAHPLVLVLAPAGYGKSSLLRDVVQTWEGPVCWYRLDSLDREAEALASRLATAMAILSSRGGQKLSLWGGQWSGEQGAHLLASLVQEMGDLLIVLDDLQHVDDPPSPALDLISSWLRLLPPRCRVVIAASRWPQVRALPAMMARQEVGLFTWRDLAFDPQETQALAAMLAGLHLPTDEAEELCRECDGWPAVLALIARHGRLKGSPPREAVEGLDLIHQFLEAEVFSSLPEPVQAFALESAVLRRLSPHILHRLGMGDREEAVRLLESRFLLVREGDGQAHLRYLRPLRAFLLRRLRGAGGQRLRQRHLQAAAAWRQCGEWEEAMYHLCGAEDWQGVEEALAQTGGQLLEAGRWDVLARWLEEIPGHIIDGRPRLLLWKARVLSSLKQVDQALALLSRATGPLADDGEWGLLAEALVVRGCCLRLKGNYAEAKESLARAEALLLEHGGPLTSLAEARKELGTTLAMSGDFQESLGPLEEALRTYDAVGDSANIAEVCERLAGSLMHLGRLAEAEEYLERARPRWQRLGNLPRLMATLHNLGVVYMNQADYRRAEAVLLEALSLARQTGSSEAEAHILANLAELAYADQRLGQALESYQRALAIARALEIPYLVVHVLLGMANTYRLMGDLVKAETLLQTAVAEARSRGGIYELGLCSLSYGLLSLARENAREAVVRFEEAFSLFQRVGARQDLARAYLHAAQAYFVLNRKRTALECLEMAARLVRELGHDHFFLVEARRLPVLVQYAAAHKVADGYYRHLLRLMRLPGSAAAEAQPDAPTLEVYVLGNVRVKLDGREVTDLEWRSEKSKEMFVFMVVQRRPLRKEEIAAALWPDLPEERVNSLFHSNLYRLRQALYPGCVVKDGSYYMLDREAPIRTDMEEFVHKLEAAHGREGQEAIALLEEALALYRGPFAADFYSEWVEPLRREMEEKLMSLLTRLARLYEEAGQHQRSIELYQRVLEVDEFNELAWRQLVLAHIRAGAPETALYCFHRYLETMGDEGPEVEELRQLLRQAGR